MYVFSNVSFRVCELSVHVFCLFFCQDFDLFLPSVIEFFICSDSVLCL